MKLIIDISEEAYNGIKVGMRNKYDMIEVGEAIENSIPLDDLRVEIEREKLESKGTKFCGDGYERFYNKGLSKALKIIDKYIGK